MNMIASSSPSSVEDRRPMRVFRRQPSLFVKSPNIEDSWINPEIIGHRVAAEGSESVVHPRSVTPRRHSLCFSGPCHASTVSAFDVLLVRLLLTLVPQGYHAVRRGTVLLLGF